MEFVSGGRPGAIWKSTWDEITRISNTVRCASRAGVERTRNKTGAVCLALLLMLPAACSKNYSAPPVGTTGPITVQIVQPPVAPTIAGRPVNLAATVLNDTGTGSVSWTCAPANACGSFNPSTTGYQIGTVFTPSVAPPNGPITTNLAYSVTITATSVTDSSKSTSLTVNVAQPYAFVLGGFASFGMVGSIILDGAGHVIDGEAEGSANAFYSTVGRLNPKSNGGALTGNYSLDSTGHGQITFNLNTSCCGTFTQTHSLTATSNSHLAMAEIDQFNGLTIGGVGSLDLQTAGNAFSVSQISGGYSFTTSGFNGNAGLNGSWGGIFTANGGGSLTGGQFDGNFVGSNGHQGYASTPFVGSFTAPDVFGHGVLTFQGVDGGSDATYSYYLVTPETLRITVGNQTSANFSGNTGSAFGQGTVAGSDAALTGAYVFGDFGFDIPGNATGAAGQFSSNGTGTITAGIMDLNDSGNGGSLALGLPFSGSYSISGSAKGTIVGPSGQSYNVYLTDPSLNLLDPNSTSGGGGGLLLETDATFSTTGVLIPQTNPVAGITGGYALILSDQNNPPSSDGGYTGSLTAAGGTFSGEGDFQTKNTVTPVTGPLSGTYSADPSNPGRYTGTVVTAPAFPHGVPGSPTDPPGTENVNFYMANGSQGFVVETDTVAPIWGILELQ